MLHNPIKSEKEYEKALKRLDFLLDINSPADRVLKEIEDISILVEQYEDDYIPTPSDEPSNEPNGDDAPNDQVLNG